MGLRSTTALHVQQSWKRLTVLLSLARLAQALLEDLRVLCVHGEVVLRCSSRRGIWRWFRSFFRGGVQQVKAACLLGQERQGLPALQVTTRNGSSSRTHVEETGLT